MKKSIIARSVAVAVLATSGAAANAVSFSQNDVNVDINGTVNGFLVTRKEDWTSASGAKASTTNSGISNGLLPGWINFVATTTVDGQDVKAHISFAPGINNNSKTVGLPFGNPNPLSGTQTNPYSQIDTRNLYLQFGNKDWGNVKVGRDIGLFGQDIILSDMTLIGVGGTTNASIPYNTTFGMIGHGYMYTGFQAQVTYTTPNADGLQGSVGLFQPSKFTGNETKTPGVQGKVSYDWKGSTPGKVWGGFVTQNATCNSDAQVFAGNCAGTSFRANGVELGTKATFDKFGVVAYTFRGKGLGLSTVGAQFFGGSDGSGNRTDSRGYFLQGTYQATAKTKVGLNYGRNEDKDGFVTNNGRRITNASYTLGVYHALNKFVNLVAEYNNEDVKNVVDSNNDVKARSVSLGAIVFF